MCLRGCDRNTVWYVKLFREIERDIFNFVWQHLKTGTLSLGIVILMDVEQAFSHSSCDWPTGDQVWIIPHSHFWLTQLHILRSLWLKKVAYYKFVRENA